MAKCEVVLPEEFLLKLSKLGPKTDEIAQKALQAGGKVVLEKVRDNLAEVVGKGEHSRSTGELQASLGLTRQKRKQQYQGRLCRAALGRGQQCEDSEYPRIRPAWSACAPVLETREEGIGKRV